MQHVSETSEAPVLALQHYGLSFRERTVLQSVSLELAAKGCHVLLGPSGTGKSTLLRTLAGLNDTHPDLRRWGTALYRGAPLAPDNRPPLLLQKAQLMVASVLENLQSGLPDRSAMTRAAQIERIVQVVSDIGEQWVSAALNTPVAHLNLRQQRTITILRHLLAKPPLLMLDEPTVGMDDANAQLLINLVRRLAEQRSVLVVMHHLTQTRRMADQVILLASGSIQEQASVHAFFKSPQSAAAQQFTSSGSCPEYPLEEPYDLVKGAHGANTPPHACNTIKAATPLNADEPSRVPIDAPPLPLSIKSAACGPRGFVWLLPGQLAGTPWPGIVRDQEDDLRDLQNVGVTRLVNLTEDRLEPQTLARYGIVGEWLPILDMKAPTATQAAELCAKIDGWLRDSQVVALHCRAGLGRTGTLLAAYWLWRSRGELIATDAIEKVRQLNQQMIQSRDQVHFLERFSTWLAQSIDGVLP